MTGCGQDPNQHIGRDPVGIPVRNRHHRARCYGVELLPCAAHDGASTVGDVKEERGPDRS